MYQVEDVRMLTTISMNAFKRNSNSFRATGLDRERLIQRRFKEFHRDIRDRVRNERHHFVDFPVRPLILVVFDQSRLEAKLG